MKPVLDDSKPIFLQIAQMIRNEIVVGNLEEGDRVPSENEMSRFYSINRATVRKGLQSLVDEGVVYKQRGIGMFVSEGAKRQLIKERQRQYRKEYVVPLLDEAKRLQLDVRHVIEMIEEEEKR